jgi:hypothetical protein
MGAKGVPFSYREKKKIQKVDNFYLPQQAKNRKKVTFFLFKNSVILLILQKPTSIISG